MENEKIIYKKICKHCGKEFETTNPQKIYCCGNCRAASFRDEHRVMFNKICPICGKEFKARRSLDVYCSKDCYEESKIIYRNEHKVNRKEEKRTCPICGTEFTTKIHNKKYCSQKCKWKASRNAANPERERERKRLYRLNNIDKIKEWESKNRERRNLQKKEYYQKHKEEKREYAKIHKDRIRKNKRELYHKNMRENPSYRMLRICRGFVRRCLENKKLNRTQNILGYTPEDLRNHLESFFYDGMSWDNYSKWEVHHIRPLDTFNFLNEDGTDNYDTIREANKLSNLIPLYIEDHKKITAMYNSNKKCLSLEEIKQMINGEETC